MTASDPAGSVTTPAFPRPAASIAVFRGDNVLLAERGNPPVAGLWSLPGGHIESGEKAREAALRELAEETGVTAEIADVTAVHDVIVRDKSGVVTVHYVLSVFYGRWLAGEPVAATDCRDARFVALDDLKEYALTPGAELIIRTAYNRLTAKPECS
jgi:8-oxo-dGTP diphosphatase